MLVLSEEYEILTRSGFSRLSKNRYGSRVSLVFAQKAEGEKHHTNHTIDNGVVAVGMLYTACDLE